MDGEGKKKRELGDASGFGLGEKGGMLKKREGTVPRAGANGRAFMYKIFFSGAIHQ